MRGLVDLEAWAVDLTPLRVNGQYRLLFAGRLVSTFALGMLMVVLSVQTYDLTRSSVQVALVNTVLGVSALVGSLVGGVLADRVDRRRVILVSRALAVAGFVVLALDAADPSLPVLYLFAAWDGVTGAVGSAAFGAAVPAVVPAPMLAATGALMAIAVDLGAAAAPLVAGVLAAARGAGTVYWTVAATSAVSWALLWQLRPIPPGAGGSEDEDHDGEEAVASSGWFADLSEGLTFAHRDGVVSGVLTLGFLQILLASPHVLVPELVQEHLGGGPDDVGLVFSAASVGALVATTFSGWVPRVRRVGLTLGAVLTVASLGVVAFGLAPTLGLAVAAMALVGACDVVGEILRFVILAERTPDRLRGRVHSVWNAQVTVGDSLGGPVLSVLARVVGVPGAIALGGGVAAVATVAVLARTDLRTAVATTEPDDADAASAGAGSLTAAAPADPAGTAAAPADPAGTDLITPTSHGLPPVAPTLQESR